MRPLMTRPASSLICIFLVALGLSACRTTAGVELNLPNAAFEKGFTTITKGPRGAWHIVAEPGQRLNSFVAIQHDDQHKIFYVVEPGQRAGALLSVSDVDQSWLAEAEGQPVTARFFGADAWSTAPMPEQGRPAPQTDDAPIGYWSGNPNEAVIWHSDPPQEPFFATVAPVSPPPTKSTALSDWIVALLRIEGNTLTVIDGEIPQGRAFLVQGEPQRAARVRVVNLTEVPIQDLPKTIFDVEDASGSPDFGQRPTPYEYVPLGRRLGADILVFNHDNEPYVAAVGAERFSLGSSTSRPAMIARDPVRIMNKDHLTSAVRGLGYVARGAPRAALMAFASNAYLVDASSYAARFRLAELAGWAGRSDWARAAIFSDSEGLPPDRLTYFAMALAADGDHELAQQAFRDAALRFNLRSPEDRALGQARARAELAVSLASRGEYQEAFGSLDSAIQAYKSINAELYVADIELLYADLAAEAGELELAVRQAERARSRYYHAGARYDAALAETKMASLLRAVGRTAEAELTAALAVQRLKDMGEPVAEGRARVVLAQAGLANSTADSDDHVKTLEEALQLDDPLASAAASATLVLSLESPSPEQVLSLGPHLVRDLHPIRDPLTRAEVQVATGKICAFGLPELVEEGRSETEAACGEALAAQAGHPSVVGAFLAVGYRHLQVGDLQLARSMADDLRAKLDSSALADEHPRIAARLQIFSWAIDQRVGNADPADLQRALGLFGDSLRPDSAAAELLKVSDELRARGLPVAAVSFAQEAARVAKGAGQADVAGQAWLAVAHVHRRLRDWGALEESAKQARDEISSGLPANPSTWATEPSWQLATAHLLLAHAQAQLGRESRAARSLERALSLGNRLDASQALRVNSLDLSLSRLRGDKVGLDRSVEALRAALELGAGSAADRASAQNALADALLVEGRAQAAATTYKIALASLKGDEAAPASARVDRAHALAQLAGLEAGDSPWEAQLLSSLHASRSDDAWTLAQTYTKAIHYFVMAAKPGRAARHLDELQSLGLAPTQRCLRGRVSVANGSLQEGLEALRRCAARLSEHPDGQLARLRAMLADPEVGAAQSRAFAESLFSKIGAGLPSRERERLSFIAEFGVPEAPFDESKALALEGAVQREPSPANLAKYADLLLQANRIDDAVKIIETNSAQFYDGSEESAGKLVRLRLEAKVRALQPWSAGYFARRALSESQGLREAQLAGIELLLAQNALIAGDWWSARAHFNEASDLASSSTNSALRARLSDLAGSFKSLRDQP